MTSAWTSSRRRLGWAAWLAAVALLAQGLWPASAMARTDEAGFHVQMCTPHGLTDPAQAPAQTSGDCCSLCVLSPAVAPAEAPAVPLPVRYAVRQDLSTPPSDAPEPRALAPPRPPSQGPPPSV
jgi:hypothetical protein